MKKEKLTKRKFTENYLSVLIGSCNNKALKHNSYKTSKTLKTSVFWSISWEVTGACKV